MTDDRRESYNPPIDTAQTPGEGGQSTTNEPGNNAAPNLDTTLDTDPADATPRTEAGDP